MKTHKASNSESIFLKQQMVILLEKEANKPAVVLNAHAILWRLKGVNLLWIFTDMQLKKIAFAEVSGITFLEGYWTGVRGESTVKAETRSFFFLQIWKQTDVLEKRWKMLILMQGWASLGNLEVLCPGSLWALFDLDMTFCNPMYVKGLPSVKWYSWC